MGRINVCNICELFAVAVKSFSVDGKTESFVASANVF